MYEINAWWYCGAIAVGLLYGIWGFRTGMWYARRRPSIVQKTIHKQVTGSQIAKAVEKVAGQNAYVRRDCVDGEDVFIVGQRSHYPYEHLIVNAGGKHRIALHNTYDSVTVMEHDWGGVVYATGYSHEAVIKAVEKFAQKLQTQL